MKTDRDHDLAPPPRGRRLGAPSPPEPMEWIQVFEGDLPGGGTQFIPTPCQQCQNPPCVNVCPVAATFSTPEGTVLINRLRCTGCRICLAASPYARRFLTWGNPPIPAEAKLAAY